MVSASILPQTFVTPPGCCFRQRDLLPTTPYKEQSSPPSFSPLPSFIHPSSSSASTTTQSQAIVLPQFNLTVYIHLFSIFSSHTQSSIATMSTPEPIKVLFTLRENVNALDFIGPLEVLTQAQHNINDDSKLNDTRSIQSLEFLHLPFLHDPTSPIIPPIYT